MLAIRTQVSVLLCGVILLSLGVEAQQESSSASRIRKRVDLVLVDLLLTDAKGNALNGLRAHDLKILDENNPQEIAHFSQDEIPLAIALLVDASGSMQPGMEPLRQGLTRALPTLKSEDRVALFSFDRVPTRHVPMTSDFESLTEKIRSFHASGSTNITEAIYRAAEYLRGISGRDARRVIVLVSDTIPTDTSKKPVESALLESEVALFCIRVPFWIGSKYFSRDHMDQLHSMGSELVSGAYMVDQLAAASGGLVIDVKRPEGIQAVVEHMFRMLKTRYTLGFYPSPPGEPGSIRRIEIRLRNAEIERAMPGTIFSYRNRYRVPPEPAKPSNSVSGGKIRK